RLRGGEGRRFSVCHGSRAPLGATRMPYGIRWRLLFGRWLIPLLIVMTAQAAFGGYPGLAFLCRRDMALLQAIKAFPEPEANKGAELCGAAQEIFGQQFGRALFDIL